jgi:ArsR family transcriptional regulator, arsenate/arsenite/antimonite-responsive transcriptional repressor
MKNEEAIAALAALAQGTRLETFRLLVKHEPAGVPAGELARLIDVPQNTMSAHLAILSRAGLVMGERHSRTIIYRANLEGFRELTLFMIQDCCGGSAELCEPLLESLQPCCPPKKSTKVTARARAKPERDRHEALARTRRR